MSQSGGGFFRRLIGGTSGRTAAEPPKVARRRGIIRPETEATKINPIRLESVDANLKPAPRLSRATTWAVQLQRVAPEAIANCPADVVVIDPAPPSNRAEIFSQADVTIMKRRPAASNKTVLAYLSIGEAEPERAYWSADWRGASQNVKTNAPSWLADQTDVTWADNHNVRFWQKAWQLQMFGGATAALDRIIDAGFDGVCLGGIERFSFWMQPARGTEQRPTADAGMADFVERLADHARITREAKDFAVVPWNGEPLLAYPRLLATISGIVVDGVFFHTDGRARTPAQIEHALSYLRLALEARVPILGLEYVKVTSATSQIKALAIAEMQRNGMIPHIAKPELDALCPIEAPRLRAG